MTFYKNNQSKIINFLKGVLIFCLAIGIVFGCSSILTLKSEDGISQFKSYYKQPKDSVDLLFMGSSHTYCNISTGIIWEKYGISSFDLGGAEAPTWSSYYQMKEALKYQRPKVVAFEVSTAAIRPGLDPPEFWIEDNDYGMKWNRNRIDLLKVQTNDWLFKRIVFPLSTMHQRYSELTADDFIDVNNTVNYKGYDYRNGVFPVEVQDVSNVTDLGEITDRAEEYLYKIIELCKSEDIELWFFITPYSTNAEHQAIYNYIELIADSEGIPYVNLNDPEYIETMGFDYETDLADELHVNISGSEKISTYLGRYLKDEYNLPDHRGDVKYSSWDIDAMALRMQRADEAIREAGTDTEFINSLREEGYLTFISFGSGASKSSIPDEVMSGLLKLGVPLDELTCGNALIVQNGNILYSGVTDTFSATIPNKYDNIKFSRNKSDDENRAFETYLNINGKQYEYTDLGVEIYAYDMSNSLLAGSRQIICE